MSDPSLIATLRGRLALLIGAAWLTSALICWSFIYLVLGLASDQQSISIAAFSLAGVSFCGLSIWAALRIVRPLLQFEQHLGSGAAPDPDLLERTMRSSRWVFTQLGAVGLAGPTLWMTLVGLLSSGWSGGEQAMRLPLYVILGLFASMLVGSVMFFIPQFWLGRILEKVVGLRPDAMALRGLSLKWKIGMLGFGLATIPTLLVGSMSFHTANVMLDLEVGHGLHKSLVRINDEVQTLLHSGAGRSDIERHLANAALKIDEKSHVHLRLAGGEIVGSLGAPQLAPELFELIQSRFADHSREDRFEGTATDPGSLRSYAYALNADGSMISVAPLIPASQKTVQSLFWLIVGITLASMAVAGLVGTIFATNLGGKISRMVEMTRQIAKGKMQDRTIVFSDDELGQLGSSLYQMTDNLRHMVQGVTGVSGQIATTCRQLLIKASAISTGAEMQAKSVVETSSAVGDLDSNIQAAADNLQSLADSAQETAEAAHKVGESFNLMLTEASGLQATVEHTGTIVEKMAESVADVSGIVRDLSEGAGRSAVSMSEIDQSISAVTVSAADTAHIARQAIEAAQDGAVAVRRTVGGMDRIVDSTRQAADVMVGLSHRVEDIGSILGVIEEIADQTNLLALNAAIIAAQAGEHGRSFAVVADEIRSLAERTASSTREIGQMISDIQSTSEEASLVMQGGVGIVNEGVALAQQAGDSLNQILISVQKAAENVEEIASNTETQAKSSDLVTREIARVADMAKRITQVVAEQQRAGAELQKAFHINLKSSRVLGKQVSQQAQENRQVLASITAVNEATSKANKAMLGQSSVSEGILKAIEQIREIAKNHAIASSEMGESTEALADKSVRLQKEIEEFQV